MLLPFPLPYFCIISHFYFLLSFSFYYFQGIFTIAELIRASKESKNTEMALKAVLWGVNEDVKIPFGVISDAISFAYRLVKEHICVRVCVCVSMCGDRFYGLTSRSKHNEIMHELNSIIRSKITQ